MSKPESAEIDYAHFCNLPVESLRIVYPAQTFTSSGTSREEIEFLAQASEVFRLRWSAS